MLVPYGYADVRISTFHAFGDWLLREHALELGLTPAFRVLNRAEQVLFLRARLFELPLDHFRPLGDPTRHLQALDGPLRPRQGRGRHARGVPGPRGRARGGGRGPPGRRGAPGPGGPHARAGAHLRRVPGPDGPRGLRRLRRPDLPRAPPLPRAAVRARQLSEAVPLRPGRRVPGHEPRAVRAGEAARGPAPERDRRGRRRPGDLPVPRRVDEQHPGVRRDVPGRPSGRARPELPLGPARPGRRLPAHHAQRPRPAGDDPGDRQAAAGGRRSGRDPSRSTRSTRR